MPKLVACLCATFLAVVLFQYGMTTHIAFRLFITCLIVCASMVLGAIWLQDRITAPLYFQITATTFVIGLASFLIWFSLTLIVIRKSIEIVKEEAP